MPEEAKDIAVEKVPNGTMRVVLPWGAAVALLGVLGWQGFRAQAEPGISKVPQAVLDRLNILETKQAATDARTVAQGDEILRRLERIENKLE